MFTTIAILDYSMARVFMWPYDIHSEIYTYAFPKFLYPVNNIIFNFSIGLTIVVAFERYPHIRYCCWCRDVSQI